MAVKSIISIIQICPFSTCKWMFTWELNTIFLHVLNEIWKKLKLTSLIRIKIILTGIAAHFEGWSRDFGGLKMYFSRLHASLIVQTWLLIFFGSISHCSRNWYCYEIYNQHHWNMWCFYVQANVHMGIEHKVMICIHAMFQHQN